MKDHRKRIVADGYDAIADPYLEWAAQIEADPRDRMLVEFSARLEPGARVLDIGCGAGVPATRSLAAKFVVTGLDISGEQITRQAQCPEGHLCRWRCRRNRLPGSFV